MKKRKIFIEASPLTEERSSGIAHATLEVIRALEKHPSYDEAFEVILVCGFDKIHTFDRWGLKKAKHKSIPLQQRPFNLLWKYKLIPPMDLFLGKGVYIFPNYKNWSLVFSQSITYVHDMGFALYPQFVSPKNQRFLAKNMASWLKRTTIIATDSKSAKRDILSYYHMPKDKVRVLYHGVDTSVYYPRSKSEIDTKKKEYGISGEYILYLGNIEPRKNLIRLIEAYKELPNSLRDNYSLVIIGGSGWLNEDILEAIKAAQHQGLRIIKPDCFVKDEDLPAIHSGATLLAHPALYEGFGLSIVQAMACGIAVIGGNNSSMPEVIGKGGLLVDATSVSDITNAIHKILTDRELRKNLSQNGLEQAKKFSWEVTADKLVQLVNAMGTSNG